MKLRSRVRVLVLASLVVSWIAGAGAIAEATLDPPQVTFTGDQSGGIASGVHFSSPPIYTVNVHSLTTDIAPAAGVSGIRILSQGANGANGGNSGVGDGGDGGAVASGVSLS